MNRSTFARGILLVAATHLAACGSTGGDTDGGSTDAGLQLPPAKKAKKVAVGSGTTYVLTTDGEVRAFGWNQYLGFGASNNQLVAKTLPGLESGVVDIGSNYQTSCAVLSSGSVKCWGDNRAGEVGNGTTTDAPTPTAVTGLTDIASIAVGLDTVCAVTRAGNVKCWGSNEGRTLNAETPDPNNTNSWKPSLTPIDVTGLGGTVKLVRFGERHACAIMTTGSLKCWGQNTFGELGNGLNDGLSQPTTFGTTVPDAVGLSGVVDVAPGYRHTIALLATGAVKSFGSREHGYLGDGSDDTSADVVTPGPVSGLTSGGTSVGGTCAVVSGKVWCWHSKRGGGRDEAVYSTTPTAVPGITDAVQVATVDDQHSCAVLASGGVKCWGDNTNGMLGIGIDGSGDGTIDVGLPQTVPSFQ